MSGPGRSNPGPIASQLTGVWTLVSYAQQQDGRDHSHPFGLNPEGFLIYTPDGFVSAQLMKPGRSQFQSINWNGGTPEEYQEAASGYIAYCGVFEVDEEETTVTHIPSVALLPNLIQGRQLRSVTLTGETLTLRAVSRPLTGSPMTSVLVWAKARSGCERAIDESTKCHDPVHISEL